MKTNTIIARGKQRLRLVNKRVCLLLKYIYVKSIKPCSEDEDVIRKEFILNIILFGTVCFMTILEGFTIYQYFDPDFSDINSAPYFFTGLYLFFVFLYTLSRKGYSSTVAYILVISYTLATTYAAFSWGPDLQQVLVSYAFIIVMAGILISPFFSLVITIFISAAVIGFNYLDSISVIHFETGWKSSSLELNDAIEISLTYVMICLIAWLSNREIVSSLRRAHHSENALREKNESLEITIEERTKELREAQAEKVSHLYRFAEFGRLSSGIFHDLMNPLSVVAMNVERLEENSYSDVSLTPLNIKDIKQSVDQAIRASRRMEDFIGSARKQLSVSIIKEQFSPDAEIRSALVLLKHKAIQANVTLTYRSQNNIKTCASISKFSQIVTNLISNAIDACDNDLISPERKIVYIGLEKIKGIDTQGYKQQIRITVRDKGCGIPKDVLGKIFDPFFTTKSEHKGMGLGLSTTKSAIEKDFNGTLTVESTQNIGSKFIFIFPIVKTLISNHDYTQGT